MAMRDSCLCLLVIVPATLATEVDIVRDSDTDIPAAEAQSAVGCPEIVGWASHSGMRHHGVMASRSSRPHAGFVADLAVSLAAVALSGPPYEPATADTGATDIRAHCFSRRSNLQPSVRWMDSAVVFVDSQT